MHLLRTGSTYIVVSQLRAGHLQAAPSPGFHGEVGMRTLLCGCRYIVGPDTANTFRVFQISLLPHLPSPWDEISWRSAYHQPETSRCREQSPKDSWGKLSPAPESVPTSPVTGCAPPPLHVCLSPSPICPYLPYLWVWSEGNCPALPQTHPPSFPPSLLRLWESHQLSQEAC